MKKHSPIVVLAHARELAGGAQVRVVDERGPELLFGNERLTRVVVEALGARVVEGKVHERSAERRRQTALVHVEVGGRQRPQLPAPPLVQRVFGVEVHEAVRLGVFQLAVLYQLTIVCSFQLGQADRFVYQLVNLAKCIYYCSIFRFELKFYSL